MIVISKTFILYFVYPYVICNSLTAGSVSNVILLAFCIYFISCACSSYGLATQKWSYCKYFIDKINRCFTYLSIQDRFHQKVFMDANTVSSKVICREKIWYHRDSRSSWNSGDYGETPGFISVISNTFSYFTSLSAVNLTH